MNCVIPYKKNSGIELRYTLRGIEKFVEDPHVILIGEKPDWMQNVEHIYYPDEDNLAYKERNIFQKILKVKRDFLFFNDDHFLLQPLTPDVYHFSGSLTELAKSYGGNEFAQTIRNTIQIIGNADNYFRHGPIFCQYKVLEVIKMFNWDTPWGYCVKSLYCHYTGIKGIEYPDLKIRSAMTLKDLQLVTACREYFSTGVHSLNSAMLAFLEQTYPDKSRFEK